MLEHAEEVFFGIGVPKEIADLWSRVSHEVASTYNLRDLTMRSVPHITLIPPQPRNFGLLRSIESRIHDVAHAQGSFQVCIGEPVFLNADTIALEVPEKDNKALYEFAKSIRTKAKELKGYQTYKQYPEFRAHISVVRYIEKLSEEERQEILGEVRAVFGDVCGYEYLATHVSVYTKHDDVWTEEKNLRIKL